MILRKVDVDGSSTIEYSEFIAHALTNNQLSHRNLQLFFDQMKPITKTHELTPEKPLDEKDQIAYVPPKKYLNVDLIHAYM